MKLTNVYLIAILVACNSCGPGKLSEAELVSYLADPENGLTRIVEKSGLKMEVIFKPSDLVMAEDLKLIEDESERKAAVHDAEAITYFVMRFSRNKREVESLYANDPGRLNHVTGYFGYGISRDLSLIADKDTISVLDVAYARTFGAAGASQILVAFEGNLAGKAGTASLFFNDTLFGTGTTEFLFDCTKLERIPKVKFP